MLVGTVADGLLEALFPRRCAACGARGWPFCPVCRGDVAVLDPPGCARCGRPWDRPVDGCPDCPPPEVEWCRSAFLYRGPVQRSLHRLKFAGLRSLTEAFAGPMAERLADRPPVLASGPVLTWVPLGRKRRRERGFDQAEILARAVARRSGLPVGRLLSRRAETPPQARRSGAERRPALAGAFRSTARPPPEVILVDDVLTTGGTAAACAGVLLEAGAVSVGVLTAARALGGPVPARCYNPPVLPSGSVVARGRFPR